MLALGHFWKCLCRYSLSDGKQNKTQICWFFFLIIYLTIYLFSGPFLINACPLRRIHQRYVIGTQTKIDISGVKIPDTINDLYFRRERKKRAKKEEGDIFQTKKEVSLLEKYSKGQILFCLFILGLQSERTEEDGPEGGG